jgi:CcmD family protein
MRIVTALAIVLCLSAIAAQAQVETTPPRTLRAYWHVFAAFTFAWLMILGYAISLARRFRRLEEKLDSHRGTKARR